MAEAIVETGRFREKLSLNCDGVYVYMDATQGGAHGPSITLHFALSTAQSRELAYKILASAEESEQRRNAHTSEGNPSNGNR